MKNNKNMSIMSKYKIMKNVLSVLIIGLLLSCGFAQNNEEKRILLSVDSLMNIVQEDFDVHSIELLQDTILILSTNEILFYPFGEFTNFKKFQEQYLKKVKEPNIDYTKSKSGSNVINIQNENNFLRLIETKEKRKGMQPRLEIVYADINDADFVFVNGISVGMNKKGFLLKIFSIVPEDLEKISVIKIASAVDFIEYYYTFSEDNTIKNITIITDYVL
jgi:hypothetical protein